MAHWTTADIPNQEGRSFVITGTGGLAFEYARALARVGADIVLAGRNPDKGAHAIAKVRAETPSANIGFELVDLASLKSIARFADSLRSTRESIDVLINNAGVMVPPKRRVTADGFELQLGTNYLSHYALTGHLLPLLHAGNGARVVTLSSVAARSGAINFDDLQAEQEYKPMPVYSQSKLACLMYSLELQRRSEANRWGITSIGAHPGVSRTELLTNGPSPNSAPAMARRFLWFLFQPASQGALPALYAATSPQARPGGYYGSNRLGETRGHPAPAKVPPQANDLAVARRLWEVSEELTHVRYSL